MTALAVRSRQKRERAILRNSRGTRLGFAAAQRHRRARQRCSGSIRPSPPPGTDLPTGNTWAIAALLAQPGEALVVQPGPDPA